jgi:hypothetical protein
MKGDSLTPVLFNFVVQHAIRRVQVNQDCLTPHGTKQLLVYAEDINKLGRSVHTIKKNAGALVVASKKTGLEVNLIKLSTWLCLEIRMQDAVTM